MANPLEYIEKYPERTKQLIGIDRWEQPRERPEDNQVQKEYGSPTLMVISFAYLNPTFRTSHK